MMLIIINVDNAVDVNCVLIPWPGITNNNFHQMSLLNLAQCSLVNRAFWKCIFKIKMQKVNLVLPTNMYVFFKTILISISNIDRLWYDCIIEKFYSKYSEFEILQKTFWDHLVWTKPNYLTGSRSSWSTLQCGMIKIVHSSILIIVCCPISNVPGCMVSACDNHRDNW